MSNESSAPSVTVVTAEIAKAKIGLSLTTAQLGIQAVLDKTNALVFNEDNLPQIKEALTEIGKVLKAIDKAHETGKAPAWAECKAWDAAKNDLRGLLAPTETLVTHKHTVLCQAVERRRNEQIAADKKKKDIEEAINTKILGFSQEITACKTNKELLTVESRINLEKTRTQTYGDQLPTLIERCNELTELLKTQKTAVKELEGLEKEGEQALANGNDEKLMEIEEKKEQVVGQIQETKVRVEEQAINSSTRGYGSGGYTQTFPTVKPKRQTWEWEIPNMEVFAKKHPELVELVPKKDKIDEIIKDMREKKEITEGMWDGLKIYLKKTY